MEDFAFKKKILILTANPTNTQSLRLSEEVREIRAAWQRSQKRQQFEIIIEDAVRTQELRRTLLENKPDIIHFSGHGGGEHGLALLSDSGKAHLVTPEALTRLFKRLNKIFKIECVLFNACYSQIQAKAIQSYVDYVIGMSKKIGDVAAQLFALGFYDTVFAGESIKNAYEIGCSSIDLEGIPEYLTPILIATKNNENTPNKNLESIENNLVISPLALEEPEGVVSLTSPFYLGRNPLEKRACDEILCPGALIRIKAPQQMGKTSFMLRIIEHAKKKEYRTVILDLRQLDEEFFENSTKFLKWFCAKVSLNLGLELTIDKYWYSCFGSNDNCTNYFEKYQKNLLLEAPVPLVIVLENFERIFKYSAIERSFCDLLRSWHEKGKYDESWMKLRLIVVHSQESYAELDINCSPFNVGLGIELPEFNPSQIKELVDRHNLNWNEQHISQLMNMIGGHPYLVRMALYEVACDYISLEELLKTAPTEGGLYGNHLLKHLSYLEENPKLAEAMKKVVATENPVSLHPEEGFKLDSMGLVVRQNREVRIRCNLYRLFFRNLLGVN